MKKNRFIHYGLVLTLIAAISAGILSIVNLETKDRIYENAVKAVNSARLTVLPKAKTFDEKSTIKTEKFEFIPGKDENGKIVGYVVTVSQYGYAANIDFVLGVGNDGKITGLNIISNQETPGLGSRISGLKWQSMAIGRDASYKFNKAVDGFAGATISPEAVYTGIKRALDSFNSEVKNR